MKLIIASNNKDKITEIKAILSPFFDDIVSLREAGIEHETVEDGTTFMQNAEKKAREIAELSGCCAIADDSGLCVDALGGAPGIYSARFCGRHGDDAANNRLLLQKMEGKTDRAAHYTCAIALCWPDGREVTAEEYFYGEGVTLVEWATLIGELMPEDTVTVRIEKDPGKGDDYRKITVITKD